MSIYIYILTIKLLYRTQIPTDWNDEILSSILKNISLYIRIRKNDTV